MRKSPVIFVILATAIGLQGCDYIPDSVKAFFRQPDIIIDKSYEKGFFKGPLVVRFESVRSREGRTVELILLMKPFGYKDSKGIDWDVEKMP